MMYSDIAITRITCELYRMMKHGWTFCEECRKKVMVEDLVEYKCPECALRLHIKSRAVVHPEQQSLIPITNQYVYAEPEGCAAVMEE